MGSSGAALRSYGEGIEEFRFDTFLVINHISAFFLYPIPSETSGAIMGFTRPKKSGTIVY
jgi:hypothetical protein